MDADIIRLQAAWRQTRRNAQEQNARIRALELEQAKQRAEQIRMSKIQEQHSAQLAKHEEAINKLYFRIEQAEDIIAHHTEVLDLLTAQYEQVKAELDSINEKLFIANNGLNPDEIARGDKGAWGMSDDPEAYMDMFAKALDDKAKGKNKADTAKLEKRKTTLENKILTLRNKIFTSEQKIKKAECDKYTATKRVEVTS